MTSDAALALSPFDLNVKGRAMELDPNWCRLHYLLAVLIYKVDYFTWAFLAGGKGKEPPEPIKHVPWINPENVNQEMEAEEKARHSAAIDSLVDWGATDSASAGEGG